MLLLNLPQSYTRVFHLWKSIDLDSAWVRNSRPYQLSFLLSVLAHLEMRYTHVLRAGLPTNAYPAFKDATFKPPPNLHTCISLVEVYRFGQCLGERFSPISTFFSLVNSSAFRHAPHSRIRCRVLNQCLPNLLEMLLLDPPPNLHTCISLVENYRFAQCLGWTISPV